jgi:hypothetical protein
MVRYPTQAALQSIVVTGLVLTLAATTTLRAQESDPATAALQHFLELDCGVGQDGTALDAIVNHADALEPELARLLREGPDGSTLAEATARAEQSWRRREAFLKTNPHLGLDEQGRLDVLTVTRDEFVSDAVNHVVRRYKEKAAVGLAAIGSPEGLRTLRETRDLADDDLRDFILMVERRFKPTTRDPDAPRRQRFPGAAAAGREPRRPARD